MLTRCLPRAFRSLLVLLDDLRRDRESKVSLDGRRKIIFGGLVRDSFSVDVKYRSVLADATVVNDVSDEVEEGSVV